MSSKNILPRTRIEGMDYLDGGIYGEIVFFCGGEGEGEGDSFNGQKKKKTRMVTKSSFFFIFKKKLYTRCHALYS